jgi:hypothetical protein
LGNNFLIAPGDPVYCDVSGMGEVAGKNRRITVFRPRDFGGIDFGAAVRRIKKIGRLTVETDEAKNFVIARVEAASEPLEPGDWLICDTR